MRKAFTLIELLVVVLIIGILAAVAVPQYQKTIEINEAKFLFANMLSIKKAENVYKLEQGTYTNNWENLSFVPTGTILPNAETNLIATDGKTYVLDTQTPPPHVFGVPKNGGYMLYLALDRDAQLCYPQGTTKGKRACRALGCAADKLDDYSCYF